MTAAHPSRRCVDFRRRGACDHAPSPKSGDASPRRVHRRCSGRLTLTYADGEWIPASRLLISASERVIQTLVAYISRRDATIHSLPAFESDSP